MQVFLLAGVSFLIGWWIMTKDQQTTTPGGYNYKGIPYSDLFQRMEQFYNLPPGLLVEVARAESNFNKNAISPANAQGIMQLVPKWHPGVDPFDPNQAIPYAAQYLFNLYTQLGSWRAALAAYNWGIGNLNNYGFDRMPTETRNYIARITSRLPYNLG